MRQTVITLVLSAAVFVITLLFTNTYVAQKSITVAEKINEMALNNCALYISNAQLTNQETNADSLAHRLRHNLPYGKEYSAMFIADSTNTIISSSHAWIKQAQHRLQANTFIFNPTKYIDGIYLPIEYEGEQYYVYKRPVFADKWTIYTVCSEKAIYQGAWNTFWVLLLTSIIGMSLMLICFVVISRQVKANLRREAAVEQELKMAAKVQMSLLKPTTITLSPLSSPLSSLSFNAFIKPAKEAGGDLYDYVEKDGRLVFCIGDVSGKGMPAALFMTQVVSLFRNAVKQTTQPAEIASQINDVLAENNPDMTFCTFFVGVLDSLSVGGEGRSLRYCNAGHNPPVLLTAHSPRFMTVKPNLALGLIEGFKYTSEEITLHPADTLLLYTDGITEAKNHKHKDFGDNRLLQSLSRQSSDIIATVLHDLSSFVAGYDQSDDITMLRVSIQ